MPLTPLKEPTLIVLSLPWVPLQADAYAGFNVAYRPEPAGPDHRSGVLGVCAHANVLRAGGHCQGDLAARIKTVQRININFKIQPRVR